MSNDQQKIRMDLAQWDLGDWVERLRAGIKVEIDVDPKYNSFSIEFKMEDGLEEIIKTIATEVLEVFFNGGVGPVSVNKQGIEIEDETMSKALLIPWESVHLEKTSLKGLQNTIAEKFACYEEEEEEEEDNMPS
jgi:hypothetical protein